MAQKTISTQIMIQASQEKIWDVLTDFEAYPEWNPFITLAKGTVKKGERLEIMAGGMRFKPEVIKVVKNKSFKWLGKLWFKGLFDGEHCFEITPNEKGGALFTHSEHFTGILVGLFAKKLDRDTQTGFVEMNQRLKKRAESH